jgi:4-diphosphocytidyl-2C-methyl-D-erythritol kinase
MLNRLIARLALVTAGLMAAALPAAAATVTFEDLGTRVSYVNPVADRYASQGLVFSSNTTYWTYDHLDTRSGAGNYSLGSYNWDNITGYFTTAVNSLSLWVGDEGGDMDFATLNVYDSANRLLTSVSGSGASWFQLSVNTSSNIARFEIVERNRVAIDNLTFSANNVPEPGTLALAGLAMVGVALVRRRRTQA